MPTLRQRFVNMFLGDEINRLNATTRRLWEAYQDGPYQLPPDQLVAQLKEYGSAALEDLVTQLQWENLGVLGYGVSSDTERARQVQEANRLWRYNPLAQWVIWTWTNYGLGDEVKITCEDEAANDVFQACWKSNPIFADDKIQNLSYNVLPNGDLYLVCYESTLDGTVKFSTIPQSEIDPTYVTAPSDKMTPLFYKRAFTVNGSMQVMYYPDWFAYNEGGLDAVTLPNGSRRSDESNPFAVDLEDGKPATKAYILHIAHNPKDSESLHGWPIIGVAASYLRAHKQFMENRLTVSAQKASFVREFTTGGGSRGVSAIKSKLASTVSQTNYQDTNPASVGGNVVHNEAVKMNDLPMSTGASDARTDWEMFTHQALIGGGLFPTTAGLDTSRWATALSMDKTQAMQWARYQTFWAAQFKRIVEIVLRAHERYNDGVIFATYDADVSIDNLSLVDFPEIVSSMSSLVTSAMMPSVANGTMPKDTASAILAQLWRLALQALGVSDDTLTADEAFIGGEPEGAEQAAVTAAIEAAVMWTKQRIIREGAPEGHPFYGNQYTKGISSSSLDDMSDDDYSQLEKFSMYSDENEGDTIDLAKNEDGEVDAFLQRTDNQLFFLESKKTGTGAGSALVNKLKGEYDYLVARNVGKSSAGFWEKIGFKKSRATGERPGEYDYEWYADDKQSESGEQSEARKKDVALRETIAQVTREYGDRLDNLVYNAINRIKNGQTKPGPMQTAFRTEHKRMILDLGPQAYIEGLREGGVDAEELDDDDKATISAWVSNQQSYVNGFAADVVAAAGNDDAERAVLGRVPLWVAALEALGGLGFASAQGNMMMTWRLNAHHATNEHCSTKDGKPGCDSLDGKRHRLTWWRQRGLIPRTPGGPTACGGWNCGCGLVDDNGELVL